MGPTTKKKLFDLVTNRQFRVIEDHFTAIPNDGHVGRYIVKDVVLRGLDRNKGQCIEYTVALDCEMEYL